MVLFDNGRSAALISMGGLTLQHFMRTSLSIECYCKTNGEREPSVQINFSSLLNTYLLK